MELGKPLKRLHFNPFSMTMHDLIDKLVVRSLIIKISLELARKVSFDGDIQKL